MSPASLTYAIGDVHGRLDLLRQALSRVRTHARGREHVIVLLGDYVDRGPDTKGVLDLLIELSGRLPLVCLMGNHEEMMLQARRAASRETMQRWSDVGGANTLQSYADPDRRATAQSVPERHILWLLTRPLLLEDAGHIFVHAGIDPRRPLTDQGAREFLWIRKRFLDAAPHAFVDKRHIVHGHTPRWSGKPQAAMPELLPHRTNLDTGAYETGVLSVGVFDVERARGPVDLISVI